MYSDVAYAPYGEQYSQAGTADPSFTGQNSDTTSTLYDFTFREHSMSQGRWISPDPAGLAAVDPTNPQSWNRYAYVMNNPMAFIDPDGMDCVYLNDAGTGVDSIDSSSDAQYDCENGIGGYWIQGSVLDSSWVNIDVNSGLVSGFGLGADGLDFSIAGAAGTNPWGYWSQTTNVPFAANNWIPQVGIAANNGFTLGIRAPGQTYSQCLAANSGNYSVYNWLPSSAQNGATKFALGNDVSGALFGDANEGTAGLLVGAGVGAAPLGVGTAGTFGRRTASIFNLNLSGTTGPAPTILGKTGAAEVVGWVSGAFELKLAADIGATAAEALNCIGHR